MNRTLITLVFSLALLCTAGAAQARSGNTTYAATAAVPAAANNPVLPPVVERVDRTHYGAWVASAFTSWTDKIKTFHDTRLQEICLTTAIYFEARSESQLGQFAVATVILNRVKASHSSSICGVVYKGASHLNACQFSFACDSKPDLVDDARAWKTALEITALVLANDEKAKNGRMLVVANATHYHADYVDPYWSKSLNRLTKIGRHIFYSQS